MRILVISSYFGPETSVGVLRINAFVKYWARAGHHIDVVTMPFRGVLPKGIFDIEGVRVFSIAPFFISGHQSGDSQGYAKGAKGLKKQIVRFQYWLKREFLSNYLDPRVLWWPKVAWFIKNKLLPEVRYDFIFSTVPSYTAHSAAAVVKRFSRETFWVADYRDLWSGNPMFPGCTLVRFIEKAHEKLVLSKADLIVSINGPLVEELRAMHGGDRYLVVPNGFDDSELEPTLDSSNLGIGDGDSSGKRAITIVYAGSILPGLQDPSPLLQAIYELAKETVICRGDLEERFYGDYSALDDFPLSKNPIVNSFISCCGKVSRQEILKIQKVADFLLFLRSKPVVAGVGSTTGVVSGKLFEYMISGTEIMAVRVTEDMIAAEMILLAHVGDFYGDDVKKIKQRITRAIQVGRVSKVSPDMSYLDQFKRS